LENFIDLRDTFYSASTNFSRFNEKINNTFSEAYSVYLKTILEDGNITKDLPELDDSENLSIVVSESSLSKVYIYNNEWYRSQTKCRNSG